MAQKDLSGFNINKFVSNVSGRGILKSSNVMVNLWFPSQFGLNQFGTLFNDTAYNLQFMAEATNLPGVSFATTEIRRHGYGVIEKKPYVPIFTDINVVFRLDRNADLYKFFQTWMKMIINMDGRQSINSLTGIMPNQGMYEVAYKNNYISLMTIHVGNQQGNEALQLVLTEAYPIFLGEIPMAWQATNDYIKVPVKFTFKDWYIENVQNVNEYNLLPKYRPKQPYGPPVNN